MKATVAEGRRDRHPASVAHRPFHQGTAGSLRRRLDRLQSDPLLGALREQAGLPGVIAHGMLTMGTALRVVTNWVGDPSRVTSYFVRFTRPVVVPDDADGVEVEFSAQRLSDRRIAGDHQHRSDL